MPSRAVLKDAAGHTAARAFEEGSSSADLLPALGRLARHLKGIVTQQDDPKRADITTARDPGAPSLPPAASPARSAALSATAPKDAEALWLSPRITGTYVAMAPGRTLPDGTREIYLAGERTLQLFQLGKSLKLLAEISFKKDEQILGVDSADLDGDGIPEIYVTLYNGDALVSEVWIFRDGSLKKLADKLPYYFRGLGLNGEDKKIYAQKMSLHEDFEGDIFQVVKKGDAFEVTRPVKLPAHGYLYNFNQFSDRQGSLYYLELGEEGRLAVIAQNGEEIWRSREKYGASELFFRRELKADVRFNGEPFRKIFIKQRIEVTPAGEAILPQNAGSSVFGNDGNSFVCGLAWNGSGLDKKWRSTESENYLADYFYDQARRELVRLETTKPAGMFDKGASIITVQKLQPD